MSSSEDQIDSKANNNEENDGDEDERSRTLSSCQKELDDIQGILEGLSTDIKTKIDEKTTASLARNTNKEWQQNSNRKSSLFASSEITTLMQCSEGEFDEYTNRMSLTDLDLTQRTIEAEIRVRQVYLQQNTDLHQNEIEEAKEKVVKLQQRMFKCIRKRGQLLAATKNENDSKNSDDEENEKRHEAPAKPDRFRTRQSIVPREIEEMSKDELVALLRHNSVDFQDSSNRRNLLQLVSERLLSNVSSSSWSSWEPPDQSTLQWNCVLEMTNKLAIETNEPDERHDSADNRLYPMGEVPTSPDMTSSPPPDTPVESYFKLNPSDMNNYIQYKAANNEKLVDWDPTPLLKELYHKITTGSRAIKRALSKSKRVSCMQGYLDKLPMNQIKVKAFKGWKRRFFQVARGKLYYYEDHKSETPFGHIDILGSEIEGGDSNTILITARLKFDENKSIDANKLVLRCGGEPEWKDWLFTLKRMATIEPPMLGTLKREGSLKKKNANEPLIIDLGASTVKAGLVSDAVPVLAFPAAFAVKKTEQQRTGRRFTEAGLPDAHSCRCGYEAFYPEIRKDAKIVYPMKPTMRIDKYAIKVRYVPGFLEKIFRDLEIEAADRVVVISHSRHLSNKDKEVLLDYLFGQMGVHAVYMQQQALLALYSYSVTTGLIVDIGDHIDVIPVIEGVVIEKGVNCLPFGGQQITEYLGKLLTESGYRNFVHSQNCSHAMTHIVKSLKSMIAMIFSSS